MDRIGAFLGSVDPKPCFESDFSAAYMDAMEAANANAGPNIIQRAIAAARKLLEKLVAGIRNLIARIKSTVNGQPVGITQSDYKVIWALLPAMQIISNEATRLATELGTERASAPFNTAAFGTAAKKVEEALANYSRRPEYENVEKKKVDVNTILNQINADQAKFTKLISKLSGLASRVSPDTWTQVKVNGKDGNQSTGYLTGSDLQEKIAILNKMSATYAKGASLISKLLLSGKSFAEATATEAFLFGPSRKFFYYLTTNGEHYGPKQIPYTTVYAQTKEDAVAEFFSKSTVKKSPLTVKLSRGWSNFYNGCTFTMLRCEYTPDKDGKLPGWSDRAKAKITTEETYKGLPELAKAYHITVGETKLDESRKAAYETARKLAAKIFTTRICDEYGFAVYTSDDDIEEFIDMDSDSVAIIHIDTFDGNLAPDRGLKRTDPQCITYTNNAQKVFEKYFAELKSAFAKTQYGQKYQISDDWGNPIEGYVYIEAKDGVSSATEGVAMEGIFSQAKYDDPDAEIELRRNVLLAVNAYAKTLFTPEICDSYGFNLNDNIIAFNYDVFLKLKRSYGFWMNPSISKGTKAPQDIGLGPGAKYIWRKWEDEVLKVHMDLTAKMAKWLAESEYGEQFVIKSDRSHTLCSMIERVK